jgi:hypothetical protein
MSPNACQIVCLQFQANRLSIGFQFVATLLGRSQLAIQTQNVLHVMGNFMCDDVSLSEVAGSIVPFRQLFKE